MEHYPSFTDYCVKTAKVLNSKNLNISSKNKVTTTDYCVKTTKVITSKNLNISSRNKVTTTGTRQIMS